MPPVSASQASPQTTPTMPTAVALEIIERIRDEHELDVTAKLALLEELSEESISFKAPDQAMKMISMLGQIISSNLDPRLRAAVLAVMARMIDLEKQAELQHGRPQIKWDVADMIWENAKRQEGMGALVKEGLEMIPGAQSKNEEEEEGGPKDGMPAPKPGMAVTPPLTQAPDPNAAATAPQPAPARPLSTEPAPEPAITKVSLLNLLRTIAAPDSEETMRELANKVIAKIESQTAQRQPCPAPTCTEG